MNYGISWLRNAKEFLFPLAAVIMGVAYYGAIVWFVFVTLAVGAYIMIPGLASFLGENWFTRLVIPARVKDAVQAGEKSEIVQLFKFVILKHAFLICCIVGFKWIIFGKLLGWL